MDFLFLMSDWLSAKLGFPVLEAVGALVLLLNGVIAVCLFIPGEQPEKFLQKVVDVLSKASVKKQ